MIFTRIGNRDHIPFPSARRIWRRGHAVVGTPPCAADAADARPAEAEGGTPANSGAGVDTQAPCFAMHMRSIDFSRPITVGPLGKENGRSSEDRWIIAQTSMGARRWRNNNCGGNQDWDEPDLIRRCFHRVPDKSSPTRRDNSVLSRRIGRFETFSGTGRGVGPPQGRASRIRSGVGESCVRRYAARHGMPPICPRC